MVNLTIKDLLNEKFRMVLVILGLTVSFLTVHIGVGMVTGTAEQFTVIIDKGEYDAYIVQRNRPAIFAGGSVSDEMYNKTKSISGVDRVDKFIMDWIGVEYKDESTGVLVIGYNIKTPYFEPWNYIDCDEDDLKKNTSVIIDKVALKYFPELKVNSKLKVGIFEQKLKVKGFTEHIENFGSPIMFMNFKTAKQIFNKGNESTYLAVKLEDGYSVDQLKDRLKKYDDEIKVYSTEEMKEITTDYILFDMGIATSIGILAIMGFFVAMIILSITLYQSVVEKIPELVSLKALGAKKSLINNIIIGQTVLIVSIAYAISITLALIFAPSITYFSALPVGINPIVTSITFGISVLLGIFCSLFSIRKVHKTDPAIIFRA